MSGKRPLIYAHRGGAGIFPEHTLAAFLHSIQLGVDAIDIDVQITQDNIIVAHHDATLNPATTRDKNGNWVQERTPICELSFAKLQEYDVSQCDLASEYCQELYPEQQSLNEPARILSLDEIIAHTKAHPQLIYQIEIKTEPVTHSQQQCQQMIDGVLTVLTKHQVVARAELQSFDWRGLLYAKKIMPNIAISCISEESADYNNLLCSSTNPDFAFTAGFDVAQEQSLLHLLAKLKVDNWSPYFKNVTADKVALAHQLGIKVIPWTPDAVEELQQMIKLQVDGIITNRPERLLQQLNP